MRLKPLLAALASAVTLTSLALTTPAHATPAPESYSDSLRNEAPKDVRIGSATWGQRDLAGYDRRNPTTYQHLLATQFNSITPENDMKWQVVHPAEGVYDFSGADAVVEFARLNRQGVRGHTLLWHSQNSDWVTAAAPTWTCEQARGVLKEHIDTVVGRYAGKIYEWDVANEIFQDDWDAGGVQLRTRQNPFLRACAADPVALIGDAFRWAHAADPNAVLFLNDYNAEGINNKTNAYYALAKQLLADGVPLGGFGAQGHLSLQYGFDPSIQANFERFAALGLKVAVTEADVRIPLTMYAKDPVAAEKLQAERYDAMLKACLNVPACSSYTVWQFADQYSWVPATFPTEGHATIMTEAFEPKPAFTALQTTLRDATPGNSPRTAPGR